MNHFYKVKLRLGQEISISGKILPKKTVFERAVTIQHNGGRKALKKPIHHKMNLKSHNKLVDKDKKDV